MISVRGLTKRLFAARSGVIVATTTTLALVLVTTASVVIWTFHPDLGLPVGKGLEILGGPVVVFATGSALALGLGVALRSAAGGLVTVIALVLVLPPLVAQLPNEATTAVAAHLPGSGALFPIFGDGPSDEMATTTARVTLAVWAAGALVLGGARLLRSDPY